MSSNTDSKLALLGYTLGGTLSGYTISRLIYADVGEWSFIGGAAGLSIGLIKQHRRASEYRKQIDEKGNEVHTVYGTNPSTNSDGRGWALPIIGGAIAYKLVVPVTIFATILVVARSVSN